MIDKSKQNITLKVCLDDAGTHNRAILDFFFAKIGQHTFRCVDTQEEANVLLIDYDYPPARKRFEEEFQQWQKPALILSISEVSIENSIWLAKPLTSRALLDAAESLQDQLANPRTSSFSAPARVATPEQQIQEAIETKAAASAILQRPLSQELSSPPPLPLVDKSSEVEESTGGVDGAQNTSVSPKTTNSTAVEQAEPPQAAEPSEAERSARIVKLCGENSDLSATVDLGDFHKDDSFFLSSLKDAIQLAKQCQQGVLLNFPQARIYVLPEIHRIFCGINIFDDEFIDLIAACNVREGGKMHILSTSEIHELNDMISQQSSALYDLEAFVWTSTLLSSRGDLPRALDPNKAVGLKHWPSLTRLEDIPHAMPIAAYWSAGAVSAVDVAKSLNIPQRYVFSFYNAANSLGLIEQDLQKLTTKQSVSPPKDAPRGLFSRLLKRLVGG